MIPEQFHFIHGLKPGDKFSLTDRIAVESAWTHNKHWKVRLWSPVPPTGEHWEKLRSRVPVEWGRVSDGCKWNGHIIPKHQHRADLLRHTLLYALGGMYLDLDTIMLEPIPHDWRLYDTVLGVERKHGDVTGLCNAVFMCIQFSQFQFEWLKLWQKFTGDGWNEYSVQAPWELSLKLPTWCHKVERRMLGHDYVEADRYFTEKTPLDGVVIAHLWRTANNERLNALTEADVLASDSTYAIHAKRYCDRTITVSFES